MKRSGRHILREPLLHFLAAGALLAGAVNWISNSRDQYRIEIAPQQVARMVELFRLQYGVEPRPGELEALKEEWIRSEIIYREALALGLDREDEIVRRRIVQKYELLNLNSTPLRPPTEEELERYYRSHLAAYAKPARRSFAHRFFSIDRDGDQGARQRAEGALAALNSNEPSDAGDVFSGPESIVDADAADIGRAFGGEHFAEDVFRARQGEWSGPFRSGLGWHLVMVKSKRPQGAPPLERVRDEVRRDYLAEQQQHDSEEAVARLRARYSVVDLSKAS